MITHIKNYNDYKSLTFEEKLLAYLDEEAVQEIAICDNNEPLVDIRDLPGSEILIFYEDIANTKVRETFGKKIIQVAEVLRELNYGLEMYEMYRSLERQMSEFERISAMVAKDYPLLHGKELWHKITQFIADPNLCPPHCSGGACDVRLIERNSGEFADMGSSINTPDTTSHFVHPEIEPVHLERRKLLRSVFMQERCAPLPTEWWHFSYGDLYWGALYGKDACYGSV